MIKPAILFRLFVGALGIKIKTHGKKSHGKVAEKYGLLFADIKDHSYPVATNDKYAKCDANEYNALWEIFVAAYKAKKIGGFDVDNALRLTASSLERCRLKRSAFQSLRMCFF